MEPGIFIAIGIVVVFALFIGSRKKKSGSGTRPNSQPGPNNTPPNDTIA